ncbi:hypothetical protein CGLO_11223 [Colletotrichum gloeosporioides Cg-14]|uniref:Uncharacterized protein n=1 Tax=Colletotrichum gloeosporioides (strain Cg-14) TaxID=1237896 RepID=T0LMI8_COLGC|nr:hypothetical protein CGLO_11223 [Colletotrichum gloeosporioides Cg-14]
MKVVTIKKNYGRT